MSVSFWPETRAFGSPRNASKHQEFGRSSAGNFPDCIDGLFFCTAPLFRDLCAENKVVEAKRPLQLGELSPYCASQLTKIVEAPSSARYAAHNSGKQSRRLLID